jgi:hypothetical protein
LHDSRPKVEKTTKYAKYTKPVGTPSQTAARC